jgi:hypothetical protein
MAMPPLKRDNSFHLLLSDDELDMLRGLADAAGLNASDFLRLYIRRTHEELDVQKKFEAAHAKRKRTK